MPPPVGAVTTKPLAKTRPASTSLMNAYLNTRLRSPTRLPSKPVPIPEMLPVVGKGENAANYANPEYDALFDRMKNMPNGPEREKIIDRMVEIARADAPWIWGVHPKKYSLRHSWIANDKPNTMARNSLKYLKIDPQKRAEMRAAWNRPVLWPLALIVLALIASAIPAVLSYRRRERMAARPAS